MTRDDPAGKKSSEFTSPVKASLMHGGSLPTDLGEEIDVYEAGYLLERQRDEGRRMHALSCGCSDLICKIGREGFS